MLSCTNSSEVRSPLLACRNLWNWKLTSALSVPFLTRVSSPIPTLNSTRSSLITAPWDIYHAARTRRILQADAVAEEDGEQSPERKRQRALAASELKGAEFVALLCCLLSPLAGAYFLTWMHSALSDGDRYL